MTEIRGARLESRTKAARERVASGAATPSVLPSATEKTVPIEHLHERLFSAANKLGTGDATAAISANRPDLPNSLV